MKRVSTGICALDEVLNGGFPEGSAILIAGRPGAGKTIFAHQMIFANATPDFKIIYFTTLAEPQIKVLKFQQEFTFFDPEKFQKCIIYQDLGYALKKFGPAKALFILDELLKTHYPRLVVIDSIKSMSDMMDSLIEFRAFILDLTNRLTTWGCTAALLAEYNEEEIEIRPESALVDGIIYLYGMEEKKQQKRFLRVLKMRGTAYSGGEIVFRISSHGLDIFPRLNPTIVDQNYGNTTERISSGIPRLDLMLGGGFPRGTITLLSGSAGTGKTILSLYFTNEGLQSGEAVVYVTFEENPGQLLRTANRFEMEFQTALERGKLHIMHVSPMELDVDEHIFRIQQIANNCGAKRIIIDSISAFEVGMSDKYKYTDYIWAISDYFKTQNINVLLTHELHDFHVNELTKHGISYVADNLILLGYQEDGQDIKRFLRVVKMRDSHHSTAIREMRITNNTLEIVENPD